MNVNAPPFVPGAGLVANPLVAPPPPVQTSATHPYDYFWYSKDPANSKQYKVLRQHKKLKDVWIFTGGTWQHLGRQLPSSSEPVDKNENKTLIKDGNPIGIRVPSAYTKYMIEYHKNIKDLQDEALKILEKLKDELPPTDYVNHEKRIKRFDITPKDLKNGIDGLQKYYDSINKMKGLNEDYIKFVKEAIELEKKIGYKKSRYNLDENAERKERKKKFAIREKEIENVKRHIQELKDIIQKREDYETQIKPLNEDYIKLVKEAIELEKKIGYTKSHYHKFDENDERDQRTKSTDLRKKEIERIKKHVQELKDTLQKRTQELKDQEDKINKYVTLSVQFEKDYRNKIVDPKDITYNPKTIDQSIKYIEKKIRESEPIKKLNVELAKLEDISRQMDGKSLLTEDEKNRIIFSLDPKNVNRTKVRIHELNNKVKESKEYQDKFQKYSDITAKINTILNISPSKIETTPAEIDEKIAIAERDYNIYVKRKEMNQRLIDQLAGKLTDKQKEEILHDFTTPFKILEEKFTEVPVRESENDQEQKDVTESKALREYDRHVEIYQKIKKEIESTSIEKLKANSEDKDLDKSVRDRYGLFMKLNEEFKQVSPKIETIIADEVVPIEKKEQQIRMLVARIQPKYQKFAGSYGKGPGWNVGTIVAAIFILPILAVLGIIFYIVINPLFWIFIIFGMILSAIASGKKLNEGEIGIIGYLGRILLGWIALVIM